MRNAICIVLSEVALNLFEGKVEMEETI